MLTLDRPLALLWISGRLVLVTQGRTAGQERGLVLPGARSEKPVAGFFPVANCRQSASNKNELAGASNGAALHKEI